MPGFDRRKKSPRVLLSNGNVAGAEAGSLLARVPGREELLFELHAVARPGSAIQHDSLETGDEQLLALYADALAVVYPPFDEDFGYVTLEAFLARKPVITCTDSGGPNEFVVDGENGVVCAPTPGEIAAAISRFTADRSLATTMGDAGYDVARRITWDGVIERLLGQC